MADLGLGRSGVRAAARIVLVDALEAAFEPVKLLGIHVAKLKEREERERDRERERGRK